MRQPEGFIEEGKENLVCKLIKGVYGLKQSGRIWHQTLRRELEKLGFRAGSTDHTVFFRRNDGKLEVAGWYVDDGLLATNSREVMVKMVKEISGSFEIQDLRVGDSGPAHLRTSVSCSQDCMGKCSSIRMSL